jgi:hypothetical protein
MYMMSTHIAAKMPHGEAIEAATKIVRANARIARTTRIASSRAT